MIILKRGKGRDGLKISQQKQEHPLPPKLPHTHIKKKYEDDDDTDFSFMCARHTQKASTWHGQQQNDDDDDDDRTTMERQ